MSMDAAFLRRIEELYPGRDFVIAKDDLHEHGTLVDQVRPRRGPHRRPDQPLQHDVQPLLHGRQPGRLRPRARPGRTSRRSSTTRSRIKPRRQLSVQFSGGEPTLSPHFLRGDRLRARSSATSPSSAPPTASASRRSRSSPGRRRRPGCASSTCSSTASATRTTSTARSGNLFDVKLRAIENLKAAGVDVTLVVTIVNTRQQRPGRRHRPVRDREHRQDQRRLVPAGLVHRPRRGHRRRDAAAAALHALAPGARREDAGRASASRCATGIPLSASGPFSDLKDLLGGLEAEWGSLKCGCHPNCGIGTMLLVDEKTQETPSRCPQLLDVDRLLRGPQGHHRRGARDGS